jgi:hypothetical protein
MQENKNKMVERIGKLLSKNYPARVVEGEMQRLATAPLQEVQNTLFAWEDVFGQEPKEI